MQYFFFFFNDPPTAEIYTLPLHDPLPFPGAPAPAEARQQLGDPCAEQPLGREQALRLRVVLQHPDRKSTRLNSSHGYISYAVFCLKKKKHQTYQLPYNHSTRYHVSM